MFLTGLLRDEKVRRKLAGEYGRDVAVGVEKEDLLEVVKRLPTGSRPTWDKEQGLTPL